MARAIGSGAARGTPDSSSLPAFSISWIPAKNRMNDRLAVATVSALPCPQGCSASAGCAITRETSSVMVEISTSTEVSMPSATTARLPDIMPVPIFATARTKLPASAIIEAFLIMATRSVCLTIFRTIPQLTLR